RPKRSDTPKVARSSNPSKQADLARLTRERDKALERETATSKILHVISASRGDLELVFRVILESATRICEAKFGILLLYDGDVFSVAALHNVPPAFADFLRRGPIRPGPHISFARAVKTKQPIQYADVTKIPSYIGREPLAIAAVELGGYRTILSVPMLREGEPIGVIVMFRQEVRAFAVKQIALRKNFAVQAAIAIENTRLFEAEQQRTRELTESLGQQTATSEVLQVISSSPGELTLVFQTMLEKATRICEAKFGNLWLREGNAFRIAVTHGAPNAYRDRLQEIAKITPDAGTPLGEMIKAKEAFQIADLAASHVYLVKRDPLIVAGVELGGIRTLFGVPMLKDGELIGAIGIYRQEVRLFT